MTVGGMEQNTWSSFGVGALGRLQNAWVASESMNACPMEVMEWKLGYHAKGKKAMDRLVDHGRENEEWAEDWDKGDTK